MEADQGKIREAMLDLALKQELDGYQFEPVDWYIIGRIAEHSGLQQAAKWAYEQVPYTIRPMSTHELAMRRLEQLE